MVILDAEFGGSQVKGLFSGDDGRRGLFPPLSDDAGEVGLGLVVPVIQTIAADSCLAAVIVSLVVVVVAVVVIVAVAGVVVIPAENISPAVHPLLNIYVRQFKPSTMTT